MLRGKQTGQRILMLAVGAGVLCLLILLRVNRGGAERQSSEMTPGKAAVYGTAEARAAARNQAAVGEASARRLPEQPDDSGSPPADSAPPQGETVESKRQFFSDKFDTPQKSLDGYRLDGVVRTPEGIALAPRSAADATSGTEEEIRKGVIESPTIPLAFPSNFMMPLWRQTLPEAAGMTIEMAISPDGQQWSRWFTLEPNSDEISPTYPDGTPNPNYGFVGGNGIANGTRLYPFARYRVTMTSGDAAASPVLHEFKIYHVDSAGSHGVVPERPQTGSGPAAPSGGNTQP